MQVSITAIGAATSVGRSAPMACAAIRASIARPRRISHFQMMDEETQEAVPLVGHPIKGYTEGFNLVGRWLRLARGGLSDLLGTLGVPVAQDARFWARTGVIAALPLPVDIIWSDEAAAVKNVCDTYLESLLGSLPCVAAAQYTEVMTMGHVGTAAAIDKAIQWLKSSGLERVLIVSSDSYLLPLPLRRLSHEHRLKTESHPIGLMPGEAGVCLLLEQEASARQRDARVHASILDVSLGQEKNTVSSGEPNTGAAMAGCLEAALDKVSKTTPFSGDFYVDLTGETWRAKEWGGALARIRPRLAEPRLHIPAISVGDTGAASGALAVCMAAYDLERRHSQTGYALVASSSESGFVGAVSLKAASPARIAGAAPWKESEP